MVSPPSPNIMRLPPRIVLDVDAELGDYLASELARHWPQARVSRVLRSQAAIADLRVVDHEPPTLPDCPTLWLADIERSHTLTELAPGYWRTPMPTTASHLRQTLQACLHGLCESRSPAGEP